MHFLHLFLYSSLILGLTHAAHTFRKVMLQDPDALCLDGSHAAYFAHQGDRQKILLYFEGGGWCGSPRGINQTIQNCFQRTKMFLGSSKFYPQVMSYSDGIFSDNPENIFRNWTLIHLRYCDGGGHQGYRKEPVDYLGNKLYFRGHNITVAQINSVNKIFGLFKQATEIVVSGQSAGGLATFMWANYVRDRVSKTAKVWALPDSGIFLDSKNYTSQRSDYKDRFIILMALTNQEVDPPQQECVRANPTEKWKCMFAAFMYQHVRVPLFLINSLYDSWSLTYLLNMECGYRGSLANCNDDKLQYIQQYKQNTSVIVQKIGKIAKNGVWAPACSNHVYTLSDKFYSPRYTIPEKSKYTLVFTVSRWMLGTEENHFHMDVQGWPENKPCSGMNN